MVNNKPASEQKYPTLWNKANLTKLYITQGKTIGEIADDVGCYWFTVKNALVKLKIKRRRYTMTPEAIKARALGGKNKGRNAK